MGHYHVVENTPGYMPESEPACFKSRRAAEQYAADLARQLRDDGYKVSGNARDGYWAHRDPDDPYDLGRVIEIVEVEGPPCPDAAG